MQWHGMTHLVSERCEFSIRVFVLVVIIILQQQRRRVHLRVYAAPSREYMSASVLWCTYTHTYAHPRALSLVAQAINCRYSYKVLKANYEYRFCVYAYELVCVSSPQLA